MKRYNSATRLQQLTRVEKISRYLLEMTRCKIKNLLQQMNAVAAKLDDDCVSLGTAFSQTECGAGTSLALSHAFGSMRQLRAAGAPFPYNLVEMPSA